MKHNAFKRAAAVLTAAAAAVTIAAVPVMADAEGFDDVPATHWAYDSVLYCQEQGVVNGVGSGEFAPDAMLTKAEFIVMVGRAALGTDVQTADGDAWYSAYVRALAEGGCLDGIAVDDAALGSAVTREEMALILFAVCSAADGYLTNGDWSEALAGSADAEGMDALSAAAAAYCVYTGLLSCGEDGSFSPAATVTRADGCVAAARAICWLNAADTSRGVALSLGVSEDALAQVVSALVVERINAYREEQGLAAFEELEIMNSACEVRAEELSVSFTHTRPDESARATVYAELFGAELLTNETITKVRDSLDFDDTPAELADTMLTEWTTDDNSTLIGSEANSYIGCGVYFTETRVYCAVQYTDEANLTAAGIASTEQ
ncbi:MAG: S-layer homology domain-containing protein [Oscillospiraceae bacterium]|nr:S-layer homology domain-containing protein [Oscillospiraceae bacterium]